MSAVRRVAIGLVVGGLLLGGGYGCWVATRRLVPLDLALPASGGRLQSPEFEVNLEADYWISFYGRDNVSIWELARDGGRVASGHGTGWDVFHLTRGRYQLTFYALPAANAREARRLSIYSSDQTRDLWNAWPTFAAALFTMAGIGLLAWPAEFAKNPARLPAYGLIGTLTLLMILIPVWLLQSWKTPSRGIPLRIGPPVTGFHRPLVLRIDRDRRWFLDGEAVTAATLRRALTEKLSLRPDWAVTLEASPDLEMREPGRAIDALQELHVPIVLAPGGKRLETSESRTAIAAKKASTVPK